MPITAEPGGFAATPGAQPDVQTAPLTPPPPKEPTPGPNWDDLGGGVYRVPAAGGHTLLITWDPVKETWSPIGSWAPESSGSQIAATIIAQQHEDVRAAAANELGRQQLEVKVASDKADRDLRQAQMEADQAYRSGDLSLRGQAEERAAKAQEAANSINQQKLNLDIAAAQTQRADMLSKLQAHPNDYVQFFHLVRPDLGGTILDPKGTVVGGPSASASEVLNSVPGVKQLLGLSEDKFGLGQTPSKQMLMKAGPTVAGVAQSVAAAGGVSADEFQHLVNQANPNKSVNTPYVEGA